jgi:hypothetical protein
LNKKLNSLEFILSTEEERVAHFVLFWRKKKKSWNEKKVSNGYSRTNLASASTSPKLASFGKYSHSPKWRFSEICETHQNCRQLANHFKQTRQTREQRVRVLAHSRVLAKKKLFACIQLSSDIGKDPNLVVIGQAI